MTDSKRPVAFKLPGAPVKLFLFFGRGDYVVASCRREAAVSWVQHFDVPCLAVEFEQLAVEFEQIPDDAEIELFLDKDLTSDRYSIMGIMTLDEVNQAGGTEQLLPDSESARELVERFGPGYLASTTED